MWLACRLIGALFRDSAIFVLDVLFTVTCTQTTLYFLFKVRRARVIEYKPQAIYWPPAQGGSGGVRVLARARELANVFEKNEKKKETTSVYGLYIYRVSVRISFGKTLHFFHLPMIPPVSLVLSDSQLERSMEGLEELLPSTCTAFSQSLSIDSISMAYSRRTFSLGLRDPERFCRAE